MAKYRILTFDGGGIKGLITSIILQRLSSHGALAGWLDKVDLIAGTSTGGLIALGIAYGRNIQEIRDLYETKGADIFDDSWLDNLVDLGKVIGADYSTKNLKKELKRLFGHTTLENLKKKVLITTFDLDNESPSPEKRTWKPKLFHNFPGKDSDKDEFVFNVGLYTSAAPTYFPAVDGYIDGGVYANNPSMCALAQSQDSRTGNKVSLEDVVLLSLGTGTSLTYIKGKKLDWGYAQWVKPLISIMMDGVAGIADYQCNQILGSRYRREAPAFPPGVSIPMDCVKKIPDMIAFADDLDLRKTENWIKTHWM